MKGDREYLVYILERMRRIEEAVSGGQSAFDQSYTIQDAVIRNLQIMAESTQRLSGAIKAKRPEINWAALAGLRNILVHDYFGVDLGVVWRIITDDVPQFKLAVIALLQEIEQG